MVDKDITDPTGIYDSFSFILSEGNTMLSFRAQKNTRKHRYRFDSIKISEGKPAIEYNKYKSVLYKKAFDNISSSKDPKYNDSIFKYVITQRRQTFESTFNLLKDSITSDYVKLKLLTDITKSALYKGDTFLSAAEKKPIINQFKELQPFIITHTDYQYYETFFLQEFLKNKILFKDFELESINNNKIKLYDIIKNNKYTVLYFWWSGCSPCRGFNKKEQKNYTLARSHNIEIISINTDKLKLEWKNASMKDRIEWKNVYAGNTSPIVSHYQVESFPTKFVINNKFEIVDIKFSSLKELIEIE